MHADATVAVSISMYGRCAHDTLSHRAFMLKLREVAPSHVPYDAACAPLVGRRLHPPAQHDALHEAQVAQAGEFLAAQPSIILTCISSRFQLAFA